MRTRSRRVVLLLGAVAVLLPLLATPPALSAGPAETDGQAAALPAIKSTILKLTGYADTTVALGLRDNQFWVTIENSRLNDSTARQREAQAARIASAIANKVKGDATFAGILGSISLCCPHQGRLPQRHSGQHRFQEGAGRIFH